MVHGVEGTVSVASTSGLPTDYETTVDSSVDSSGGPLVSVSDANRNGLDLPFSAGSDIAGKHNENRGKQHTFFWTTSLRSGLISGRIPALQTPRHETALKQLVATYGTASMACRAELLTASRPKEFSLVYR